MTDTTIATQIPGYRAGTWRVDKAHSGVGFSVKHMMISKVRGRFEDFDATFVTAPNPLESTVTAKAQVVSVNTKDENRDKHLRTNDFFEAETYPEISFVSTGARVHDGDYKVDGDLTIKGVTKPVSFDFEFGGFTTDPYGNYRAGASASATVNRADFGLTWNTALEAGGVMVGDKVTITIDLEAVLEA